MKAKQKLMRNLPNEVPIPKKVPASAWMWPVLVLAAFLAAPLWAALAFDKREDAAQVVVGRVLDIQGESENFSPSGRKTYYVARLRVTACEWSKGIQDGSIDVCCAAVTATPKEFFAGAYGHRYEGRKEDEVVSYVPVDPEGSLLAQGQGRRASLSGALLVWRHYVPALKETQAPSYSKLEY